MIASYPFGYTLLTPSRLIDAITFSPDCVLDRDRAAILLHGDLTHDRLSSLTILRPDDLLSAQGDESISLKWFLRQSQHRPAVNQWQIDLKSAALTMRDHS